jgi:hypothetical protein
MSDIRPRKLAGARDRRKRFARTPVAALVKARADFRNVKNVCPRFHKRGYENDARAFFIGVIFSA